MKLKTIYLTNKTKISETNMSLFVTVITHPKTNN